MSWRVMRTRVSPLRLVIVAAAYAMVVGSLAYELRVAEFFDEPVPLGRPEWDAAAYQGSLVVHFFPAALCALLLVWGVFRVTPGFAMTIVGATTFV